VIPVPEGFLEFLEAWDDDTLPDGAWQALLEEGVDAYNQEHDANIDSYEGFMAYVESK